MSGLHASVFSMKRALQKGFQETPEEKALIIKKDSTENCFDNKVEKMAAKGFF